MKVVNRMITGCLILLVLFLIGIRFFHLTAPFQLFHVMTGSMTPKIPQDSLIIASNKPDVKKVHVGDVITFKVEGELTSHRVTKIQSNKGKVLLTTKGDANNEEDYTKISIDQTQGKLLVAIPKVGKFAEMIQHKAGKIALLLTFLQWYLLSNCILLYKEMLEEKNNSDKKGEGNEKRIEQVC